MQLSNTPSNQMPTAAVGSDSGQCFIEEAAYEGQIRVMDETRTIRVAGGSVIKAQAGSVVVSNCGVICNWNDTALDSTPGRA